MKKISVILAAYDAAAHLAGCLDAVRAQSYENFEVLCVDDGSTDATAAILRQYAERDRRFRVFSLPANSGPAQARNLALQEAGGEYVVFCDADDRLPPTALQDWAAHADDHTDVVVGNMAFMDAGLRFCRGLQPHEDAARVRTEAVVTDFTEASPLWLPYFYVRCMFRLRFLRAEGITFPDYRRGEDPVFLCHVYCRAKNIRLMPHVVYICGVGNYAAKLVPERNLDDFVRHAQEVCAVFERHGHMPQAALYALFQAQGYGGFNLMRRLRREKRQGVRDAFLSLCGRYGRFHPEDFYPYLFSPQDICRGLRRFALPLPLAALQRCIKKLHNIIRKSR